MAAFSALLRRSGTTQTVTVAGEWSPPPLRGDVAVVGGSGGTTPVVARETIGATVEMPVPLRISAATEALLVAAVDTLNAFLRGGTFTFEATFNGAAAATIWTAYYAQPWQPQFTVMADLGHVAFADLVMTVSPFVTPAAVTLYNAEAKSTPCTLSLTSLATHFATPLTIDVESSTADDLHSLYVAVDPTSYGMSHVIDAKDLTWTGAGETVYGESYARVDNAVKFASTSYNPAVINTAGFPEGDYLVLPRVKANGAATGYLMTDYGDGDEFTWTRTSLHYIEAGYVHLPVKKVRGAATANLTVSVKSSSATAGQEAVLDQIVFLPLSWGLWSYHPATATTDVTKVGRVPGTGVTYVDDVADEQYSNGVTLFASGGALLIVSDNPEGNVRTHAVKVTLSYTPRYEWMR